MLSTTSKPVGEEAWAVRPLKSDTLTKAVVKVAVHLSLPKTKLARILDVSATTVTRLYAGNYQLSPDKKEWDFAVLLVRMYLSLDSIVGGSAEDAKKWLESENKAFTGKKPIDLIESAEELARIIAYPYTLIT